MTTTFPREINQFAETYFKAERNANRYPAGLAFRNVDKPIIAHELRAFMESDSFESLWQLCRDLCVIQPGLTPTAHHTRLTALAKHCNVTIRRAITPNKAIAQSTDTQAAPAATEPTLSFRSELQQVFAKALRSGVTALVASVMAKEVLDVTNEEVHWKTASSRISALLQETGLSRDQLLKIATTL